MKGTSFVEEELFPNRDWVKGLLDRDLGCVCFSRSSKKSLACLWRGKYHKKIEILLKIWIVSQFFDFQSFGGRNLYCNLMYLMF